MLCSKCGKDLTRLMSLSPDMTSCPFCGADADRALFEKEQLEILKAAETSEETEDMDEIEEFGFDDDDDVSLKELLDNTDNEISVMKKEDVKTPADAIRYIIDEQGVAAIKNSNHKKFYDELCGLVPKNDLKAIKTALDKGAVDILYEAYKRNTDKTKAVQTAYEALSSKIFVSKDTADEAIKAFEFGLRWDKETLEKESMIRLQKVLNYQRDIDVKIAKLEIKAGNGDIEAMKEIADYYFDNGVNNQEFRRAFEHYKTAAEKGDVYAQYKLGCCYRRGKGVKQDLKSAYEWFYRASNDSIDAVRNIAEFYNKGLYLPQDYAKEVYWLMKAAQMGDARSQCDLAKCLTNGHGTEINLQTAAYWFGKAAEQNDPEGQLNLGNCYKEGHGVEVDYDKAVEYYTLAANQNNARAQYLLGNYYYWGRGVGQEYDTAVYWFTKAAKQGLPIAEYVLARCYETGSGVNRSFTQALRWYTDAYESGYDKAKKDCERVELKLKGQFNVKKK